MEMRFAHHVAGVTLQAARFVVAAAGFARPREEFRRSWPTAVLPDDANDAKLIDYGLRRKFAVDQTSASPAVTVVDEEETVVTPE